MSDWDIEIKYEGHNGKLTKPDSETLWLTARLLYAYQHGSISQAAVCNWLIQLWQVDSRGDRLSEESHGKLIAELKRNTRARLSKKKRVGIKG